MADNMTIQMTEFSFLKKTINYITTTVHVPLIHFAHAYDLNISDKSVEKLTLWFLTQQRLDVCYRKFVVENRAKQYEVQMIMAHCSVTFAHP